MSRPTTIIEVANAAGVAVSTVSRVLNGGSASAKMQARVGAAVDELGFVPSAAARNLKLGKTGIVGIAGATTSAPWFTELLEGIEDVLAPQAGSVAICSWQDGEQYDASSVRAWIKDRRVDRLVLVRPGEREKKLVAQAARTNLPVVSVVPDVAIRHGLVIRAENHEAGRIAAEHLISLGHREVCFLGGPAESVDTMDRLEGLRERLAEEKLALPRARVRFGRDYEASSGVELGRKWLRRRALHSASAVVLGNDALALGFLRAVQEVGVRVPDDVSVMGFDGVAVGALVWPGLTSIAQPIRQMGRDIATHWNDPDALQNEERAYPSTLVQRESTAPPAKRRRRSTTNDSRRR